LDNYQYMRMPNKSLLSIIILLISVSVCCGQSKVTSIENIRTSVQIINQNKTLKKVKLENGDFLKEMPDNGCSLTGFFKSDTILKMDVWIGLSYCIKEYHYYFKDKQPIFIYETEDDFPYDKNTGLLNTDKVNRAFEGRYYLNAGKVMDTKTKGKKRMDSGPSAQYVDSLLADAKSDTKFLKSHLGKK
jgi:hypothetical protein